MESPHVTDLIPTYVLGLLDDDEIRQVDHHLDECPGCRAEMESYRAVSDRLALAVPLVAPPAGLNERIMRRIASPAQGAAPTTVLPARMTLRQRLASLSARAAPVWTPVSLLLIVGLATLSLWLWQGGAHPAAPTALVSVELSGTPDAPSARGLLTTTASSSSGLLVVQGLPVLSPSQQYQLWLIQDNARTSGGLFSVDAQGFGHLQIQATQPLFDYSGVGITVEPAGGSPGPTGAKVLGGNL